MIDFQLKMEGLTLFSPLLDYAENIGRGYSLELSCMTTYEYDLLNRRIYKGISTQ